MKITAEQLFHCKSISRNKINNRFAPVKIGNCEQYFYKAEKKYKHYKIYTIDSGKMFHVHQWPRILA